jgi:phosphoserine phosphatase
MNVQDLFVKGVVDAVCFDVDSTVSPHEGIDVLAEFCGAKDEVAKFTKQAMDGNMPFQDALHARLHIINPTSRQILDCLQQQVRSKFIFYVNDGL